MTKQKLLLTLIICQTYLVLAQAQTDTLEIWKQYQEAKNREKENKYIEANQIYQTITVLYTEAGYADRAGNCQNRILANMIRLFYRDLISSEDISKQIGVIIEQIHPAIQDPVEKAYTFYTAGYYALEIMEDASQALVFYKQASKYYEDTDNIDKKIITYQNLGISHTELHQHSQALLYYKKALSLLTQNPNDLMQAKIHNSLGVAFFLHKEYVQARFHFQKARTVYEQYLEENNPNITKNYGSVLHNIALLYLEDKEYIQAINYFQQAFEIEQETGDVLSMANTYQNWSICYSEQGQDSLALDYLFNALKLIDKPSLKHLRLYRIILQSIANSYYELQQYDLAKSYQEKLSNISDSSHSPQYYSLKANLAQREGNEAQALLDVEKASEANTFFREGKRYFYDPALQVEALYQKAYLLGQDSPEKALKTYLFCDSLIQSIMLQYHYQDNQLIFAAVSKDVYHDALLLSTRMFQKTGKKRWQDYILFFSEKEKAQVLRLHLESLQLRKTLNIPTELFEEERKIQGRIAYFSNFFAKYSQDCSYCDDSLLIYHERYEQLAAKIETKFPQLYQLRYKPKIVNLEEIQSILNPEQAIVSYSLGTKEAIVLVFTSDKFFVEILNIDENEFKQQVEDFIDAIFEIDVDEIYEPGKILYNSLFASIEKNIDGKKFLQIIPDGLLNIVAFDALVMANEKFLLEEKVISTQVSLNLLYQTHKRKQNMVTSFAGFAPAFLNTPSINKLAHSIGEVQEIDSLFKAQKLQSIIFTKDNAHKGNISNLGKQYSCIHLSTHSTYSEKNPKDNKVYFYPINKENSEANHLFIDEIYSINLQASLLVLSSCESGLGKHKKGEGILSLARSFLYIGIPNVVHSLWVVDEEISRNFMPIFYKEVLTGKPYSEALNTAKQNIIRDNPELAPFWWSPFTIIANN